MTFQETTFMNEFSEVRVRVIETRNGELLQLEAPRVGARATLDAFSLELLTQIDLAILSDLVQHGYDRREIVSPGGEG